MLKLAFAWVSWLLCGIVNAAGDAWSAPHLDDAGQAEFRAFLVAEKHSAFAIAPGGAFGWVAEKSSQDEAESEAFDRCKANTKQKCVLYAVDGRVVLDAAVWSKLWGPYLSREQAQRATVGRSIGQRFPDVAFTSVDGKARSVGALRGKVAIMHFWGSWCGPCRREMPDMQKFYERIRGRDDVALVLLQVREKFEVSRRWTQSRNIKLPLFDSGSTGEMDNHFKLTDGSTIYDRDLAARFPTTYVLDRNGIVVFAKIGPVAHWPEYLGFINDAAARSGK